MASPESLNGGLANGGLRYLSAIVHDCLRLSSFCYENSLYKRPRKCTIAHDCAQIAGSGLKPPFESPHLDFPEMLFSGLWKGRDDPFVLDTVEILDVEGCSSEQQSTRASTSTPPSPRPWRKAHYTPCFKLWAIFSPGQLQGSKTPKPETPRKKLKNYPPDPDPKFLEKN